MSVRSVLTVHDRDEKGFGWRRVHGVRAEIVDGIRTACKPSGNQKTILARSCAAVRSEIDQPKTLCNLAGIYVVSQGGFQLHYKVLLQRIND